MSSTDYMRTATRQTRFVSRLIQEAEICPDPKRAALLFGMAKEETENMSKSLRQFLARKTPAHQLVHKAVA